MNYKDTVSPENIYNIQKDLLKRIKKCCDTDIDQRNVSDCIDDRVMKGCIEYVKGYMECWERILKDDYKELLHEKEEKH